MALLVISDNLKYGKQEVLLGSPTTQANINKCGSEVEPIWAGDIYHKLADGSLVNLIDFVIQQAITISGLALTIVNSNDLLIGWTGNQAVNITLDSDAPITSTGTNSYTLLNLPIGNHTIKVQAVDDLRGLTQDFAIEIPAGGGGFTITYGGA